MNHLTSTPVNGGQDSIAESIDAERSQSQTNIDEELLPALRIIALIISLDESY
jgi:hypothetical protein